MFICSKLGFQNILVFLPVKNWLIISCLLIFLAAELQNTNNMSWQVEKSKYLKSYASRISKDWVTLENIKTWKQEAQEIDLPDPVKALPSNTIDETQNGSLVDKVSMFIGDITKLKIDAIVNAANYYLKRGGGVDGAIHRVAGQYLQQECDTLNGCPTGEAKITGGYQLPAKFVIHTVGPQGENSQLLKNCYKNSLNLALSNDVKSIAFPCISTGVYGYPNEAAAHVATFTVRKFLEKHGDQFDRVIFCTFLDIDKELYKKVLQTYFPLN
ncbi:hypothetical protein ABEB36_009001 [Hypothenemus hampei]|uniref:Macro domain-containing protein n=1 Tax=Hypothenemus hampei TaxID=57062 RepID=A0ABD1ESS8_HYPHA